MKRKVGFVLVVFCLFLAVVIGSVSETATLNIRDLKISLPDRSWRSEYKSFTESWMLYKEGCYDSQNSTIQLLTDEMSADEAMLGSMSNTGSMGNFLFEEIEYEINGVRCPAYSQYSLDYDKTTVKVFCPISFCQCLQINIFVKKGNVQGIDPYSDEVKQLLQSISAKNGFDTDFSGEDPSGSRNTETIELNADGLSFEGKTYEGDSFSFIVPDGWEVFTSKYGSTYAIKDGTSQNDYGSKPALIINHNDENVQTALASNKLYYDSDNVVSLNVRICGTDCAAIRYKEEMASKPTYWTHMKIFLEIPDSQCISIDFNYESSNFESVSILDDDVRQMIISLQQSIR